MRRLVRSSASALAVLLAIGSAAAQPKDKEPEKIVLEEEPEPKPKPEAEPEQKPAADKKATDAKPATAPKKPAPSPVPAPEPKTEEKAKPSAVLSGYLAPGYGFRYRAKAVPEDRQDYGFFGDAGLMVEGEPAKGWTGRLQLLFQHRAFDTVADVELIDRDGDGTPDALSVSYEKVTGISIEEATVTYSPIEQAELVAGALRIPFTVEQQSANTELMFPDRSAPNEVFLSGPDLGAMLRGQLGDGMVTGSLGVFNGDSLGLRLKQAVARGLTYSLRADVNPFGGFPFEEGNRKPGPFRLGVGGGLLYRLASVYDDRTGYQATHIQDIRFSGSLRVAYQGLYLAAEYLRRVQTDDFTSRPQVDEGAYANVSFFWPFWGTLAVEPVARVGYVAQDLSFDPRMIGWMDAGVSFYPRADLDPADTVKVNVRYMGERRFTEDEDAHGVAVAMQLLF